MYLGQTSTLEISQLSSLYHSSIISQNCYIFSDEVDICGMFLVDTKIGLLNCLKVARLSFGNTCFIVGSKFDFSLTINYYDKEHNDFKDIYDIQRKTILLLSI